MTDHNGPLCASLGHFVGSMAVSYCPHHQAWIVTWASGDDADDISWDHGRVDFGPFDSTEDVAERAQSLLAMLIRVHSRAWLARRRDLE